jgi:hypothetical protein
LVTITNNAPIISHPSDKTIGFGISGQKLVWIAADPNQIYLTYRIELNTGFVKNLTWISGEPITLDLSALGLLKIMHLLRLPGFQKIKYQ